MLCGMKLISLKNDNIISLQILFSSFSVSTTQQPWLVVLHQRGPDFVFLLLKMNEDCFVRKL